MAEEKKKQKVGLWIRVVDIFNKYPQYIVVLVPMLWWFPGMYLIGLAGGFCTKSNLLRLIFGYVFMVLPLWLGLFSNKKSYYIGGILIWGSFWMVGLVANYGMNCGIDWLQK
jgi:hypothetical protein